VQEFPELEDYRLKLYKWDKYLASILPLIIATIIAYYVEKNALILIIGFSASILIAFSIISISLENFAFAKLIHFFAAYGVICLSSLLFPFLKYEYFLMPLLMLTVFSTYPFQKDTWNISIGIICIISSILLFSNECFQNIDYPKYNLFNTVFAFSILYIATIEIIMTALIGLRYRKLIKEDRQKLKQQNQELERYIESNLQLENFAHLASHDLKTPLSNVIRFSQLIKNRVSNKLSVKELELFDFVIEGSQHMNETINSLFQFSQATNKKIEYSRFNLSDILNELMKDIKVELTEKDVSINTRNTDIDIYADKILLKQLFLNLILNSIKFIQKGSKPVINIDCENDIGFWKFCIQDNGIGIAPEYTDKIFLIFKRLHDNKTYQGTGVGLAICKKIVEQHGGQIWVESGLGEGSTFHFTLEKVK